VIPPADALKLQLAAIAGNEPASSYFELRPLRPDGRPAVRDRAFVPVRELDTAADLLRAHADSGLNAYVGASPRTRKDGTAAAVERVWTLWADLDDREAIDRLEHFSPAASIVNLTGSGGGHAYWPLCAPVPAEWAQRANRRLALRLGGDSAATDPARILRAAGTLNFKHSPARPVTCIRLELDVFTVDQVVRGLRDSSHYGPPRGSVPLAVSVRIRTPESLDGDRLLGGIVRTVAEAQQGNRNRALFWAVCRVAEHAGALDATGALAELRRAATQAGLGELEIERTIRSGLTAGASVAA
jgi:hypothetical protein